MTDQLLVVLRVCLLALVYLVFLRVLRAVWVELRAEQAMAAPAPAPRRSSRRRGPVPSAAPAPMPAPRPASGGAELVVVAPAAQAGHRYPLHGEATIGRGAGCAVAIDDSHVSKLHARAYPHDGSWLLEDLGSTNGTTLDGQPVTGPVPLRPGARIGLGEIVLEFR